MRNPFKSPTLDSLVADLDSLKNDLAEFSLNQVAVASELTSQIAALQTKVDVVNTESARAGRIASRLNELLV